MTDSTGFDIKVTHSGEREEVQPIVWKHLRNMMDEMLCEGVSMSAIHCGPYEISSTGKPTRVG
jgi:hypothetical protein